MKYAGTESTCHCASVCEFFNAYEVLKYSGLG